MSLSSSTATSVSISITISFSIAMSFLISYSIVTSHSILIEIVLVIAMYISITVVCVVRAWRSAALGIPSLSETSTDCGVHIGKRAGRLLLSRAVEALVDEQVEKGWGENAGGCEPAAWLNRSRFQRKRKCVLCRLGQQGD